MTTKESILIGSALLIVSLPGLLVLGAGTPGPRVDYFVYIGTFTGPTATPETLKYTIGRGIYVYAFQTATGALTPLGLAAETYSPSFLAIPPNHRYLYAVVNRKKGGVRSFSINPKNGDLTLLNEVASRGDNPCFLDTDKKGRNILVANYNSGSVAVLPIGPDGRLEEATAVVQHIGSSIDPRRQEGPHAHMIGASPDDRFAFAADLGLDKLLLYRFDAERGRLTANHPPFVQVKAGSGPRHFCFSTDGRFFYVVCEMASTISVFGYDSTSGTLNDLQTISTLPQGFSGENTGAEIAVHPNGRFLYASNRGLDSVAVFAIDPTKGTLTSLGQDSTLGQSPRTFEIDPTGSFLLAANQVTGTVVVFRIDQETGRLTALGQVNVPAPACVKFVPAG